MTWVHEIAVSLDETSVMNTKGPRVFRRNEYRLAQYVWNIDLLTTETPSITLHIRTLSK